MFSLCSPFGWSRTSGNSAHRTCHIKVLLDTCVWGGAKTELEEAGHDVVWMGDFSPDPGDEEIPVQAYGDQRVLVTLDKDFGELAVIGGLPHCGIVRLVNIRAQRQGTVCNLVLTQYAQELAKGALLTVEAGRVRIRPSDQPC